ncbi:hypothetical protein PoB_002767700 [Plakobranchus ocellatus]|uniref:Uncharacterized protein n=1 Tax=Plakobranchus ocellatus TaxID=259542 RepID=A0AAV4A2P8_9GAST|nr:hypothetical protein PoB_002767700 [Plakobranchus ocellatus]
MFANSTYLPGFGIGVFFLLGELPSKANKLHPPRLETPPALSLLFRCVQVCWVNVQQLAEVSVSAQGSGVALSLLHSRHELEREICPGGCLHETYAH